jgi:hypothetical protein
VTGTYTSMQLTIASVPISGMGYLYCQLNGGSRCSVLTNQVNRFASD